MMPELILYTFGYLSTRGDRIFDELAATGTPAVDVRFKPTSRHWQFSGDMLKKRLGNLYIHIPELGNEWYKEALTGHFKEAAIKIHDLDAGLARLKAILDMHSKAAIFCACTSKTACHRILIATHMQEQFGVKVMHL